ncbi:MAG TPA: FAD-dependent monooxygenase [Verrucomicrobiae bacterium]
MSASRTITIIGGGLAGLALGIGLRQRGVPARVLEAGIYPRHRVCGEFVSGNGLAVLQRFGLRQKFEAAGACYAQTAVFICGSRRSPVRELPRPALCLSRHVMDGLLAEVFRGLGGELRVNQRWTAPAAAGAEGVVYATGRRLQPAQNPGWFGVKAHLPPDTTVKLTADLEMHVSSGGYVGINRTSNGEINVCGLFHLREGQRRAESKLDWLRGEEGSSLRARIGDASFDRDSFCAVGGLQLRPQRATEHAECCVGDAVTMTPPVTGNGMSMAFESAELALEPLAAYSAGRSSWTETRREIASRCDTMFAQRLAWARRLQWLMMSPVFHGRLGGILLRSDGLWQWMFARTR